MNLHILYTNGDMEIISGVLRQQELPVDGSENLIDYSGNQTGIKNIPAHKPTNLILTLADGQQRIIPRSTIHGTQYLSNDELAAGYTFSRPRED